MKLLMCFGRISYHVYMIMTSSCMLRIIMIHLHEVKGRLAMTSDDHNVPNASIDLDNLNYNNHT